MKPVLTHRAKTVVDAARLHRARDRRERGETLIEGPDVLRDAVAAGATIGSVFTTQEADAHEGAHLVDGTALARLADTKTPRGPVAVVKIPDAILVEQRNLVVAVGLSDPGNVGTIVRTAAALGYGFACTPGTSDPWSPKAIRAGAGGQFQTGVATVSHPGELEGWCLVSTTVAGGDAPGSVVDRPIALLIGEESGGLAPEWREASNANVTIPMIGETESLNAAVAAGILMYAFAKGSGNHRSEV